MSIERIIAGCIVLQQNGTTHRAVVNGGAHLGIGVTEKDALMALINRDTEAVAEALLCASDNAYAAGFEAGMREVVGNVR